MDPNQPQPQFQPSPAPEPSISVDYLNQIAPQAPKRKLPFTRKQLIIAAVLGFAVVLVLILALTVGLASNKKPLEQLAASLQGTQTIAASADTLLKDSQLRVLNSNLEIYLTNTNRDIAAPLLKDNVDVTKLDKTIVASEAGTDVLARLEDARLNAVYDSTYAREMSYRLDSTVALMKQIYGSTNNSSLKTFLNNAYTNLAPTQQAFANFNSSTE